MSTAEAPTSLASDRRLASGRLAHVDASGKVELATCSWLVQVPSGNPEPDFPEDCYRIVECGAPVRVGFDFEATGAFECDHGHFFLGAERQAEYEWELEEAERRGWGAGF